MALSTSTILSKTKDYLYNSGLGEKPSIRQGNGSSTVTGDIVTVPLATDEGAKLRPGHILSSYSAANSAAAYVFYVLSVSTDTATCVNGWQGATAIANSTAIPSLLEHQAPVTEYRMFQAIDEIVESFLWPTLYDIRTDSFTPDMTSMQSNADADDEYILRAWQQLGGVTYQVPASLVDNIDTSLFASGKMLQYDVVYPGTVYYSAGRKIDLTNSTNTAYEGLIAKGAAAILLEGTEASTQWESAKNDARERRTDASRSLWQSFYQTKRELSDQLSRDTHTEFVIERG